MNEVCVSVLAIGSGRYRVDVPGSIPTSHEVTLPGDYLAGLGLTGVPAERVIAESFRFQLERELSTSILRTFLLQGGRTRWGQSVNC